MCQLTQYHAPDHDPTELTEPTSGACRAPRVGLRCFLGGRARAALETLCSGLLEIPTLRF